MFFRWVEPGRTESRLIRWVGIAIGLSCDFGILWSLFYPSKTLSLKSTRSPSELIQATSMVGGTLRALALNAAG